MSFYKVGYDAHVIDFALNLFLTTKTALFARCLCLKTVPHSQIPGLNTDTSVKSDKFCFSFALQNGSQI